MPPPPETIDRDLELAKRFLDEQWGPPAVEVQLRALFSEGLPPIPPPQRWGTPYSFDITQLIWEQVQSEKFIEDSWPSIKMLLKEDTCNTMWVAQALTVLALFNIIKILPLVSGE